MFEDNCYVLECGPFTPIIAYFVKSAFHMSELMDAIMMMNTAADNFYYLLGKGGYVFGSVGLSACLSVSLWTLLKQL